VRKLLAALFVPDADGAFRIPILGANLVDIGAYLNHSDRPNMRTADGHRFVTKRRIRSGKEMTVERDLRRRRPPPSDPLRTGKIHCDPRNTPSLKNTRYAVVPVAPPSNARHLPFWHSVPPWAGTASNAMKLG
jgi:hypothetical protein